MNVLYGTMGQRSNLSYFARVRNDMEVDSLQRKPIINIKDWSIMHNELLKVAYEKKMGFGIRRTSYRPLIAGAITSNARVRLFRFLLSLHESHMQYCDAATYGAIGSDRITYIRQSTHVR